MNHGDKKAKPRRAGRGFARLLWSAFASLPYRIGLAGSNAFFPFLPVALDGAGYGAALLWGRAVAMTERPFSDHRAAALALLNGDHRLNRKAGQFLGQIAVDPSPMSQRQADWLAKLLEKNGQPPLAEGGAK